jgi:phosphoglycolate phosphatase
VSAGSRGSARAVLFDLDGVLIDSFDVWLEVVNEVARRFSAPPISAEKLHAMFGQGLEEDTRTVFRGRTVDEIRAAYDESMPRHVDRVRVNPYAADALDELARRGVGRAVVTNTQDTLATRIVEVAGLLDRLDVVAGVGAGLREKPHPDLLLAALERLAVPARDALMVGDTSYDEAAARAAGVAFLHYDIRRGESLSDALAGR